MSDDNPAWYDRLRWMIRWGEWTTAHMKVAEQPFEEPQSQQEVAETLSELGI